MSTSDLLGSGPAPTERPPRTTAGLLRTAGLGALLGFAAWLLVPVRVFLMPTEGDFDKNPELFYKTAEQIADERWSGLYYLVAFGGIGIGLLVLVTALGRAAGAGGVVSDLGLRPGQLGGFAFVLAGSVYVGFYAFGDSSGEITDEESVQRLVHVGVEVASTGLLVAGAVGFAALLLWLGTAGRTAGIAGVPALIAAVVFVLALIVPLALAGQPMAAISLQPLFCLVLGIAFLVKARKAA